MDGVCSFGDCCDRKYCPLVFCVNLTSVQLPWLHQDGGVTFWNRLMMNNCAEQVGSVKASVFYWWNWRVSLGVSEIAQADQRGPGIQAMACVVWRYGFLSERAINAKQLFLWISTIQHLPQWNELACIHLSFLDRSWILYTIIKYKSNFNHYLYI